jgi:uncharacterized membrane protein
MAMMAIVTIVIAGFVVWAVTTRRAGNPQVREPSARDALDTRLARGDIDTRQHREHLDALDGNATTQAVRRSRR